DEDADCVISMTPEDFMALVSGDLNPMMAMMTGKVKIKGDMGVAMKLQSLLG
ncbi:MAG: SCP2 sterol-binding domain-containing protein, partial [Bacteroidota bacterium]